MNGSLLSDPADHALPLDTTATLLAGARAGDAASREALFERFLPVLTRWARHRLPHRARDLAETDDLVQVTLVRALHRIGEFEARREGAFLAYLRTILLNTVREEIRRSSRRGIRAELHDDIAEERESMLDQVVGRDRVQRWESALARLPEDLQQAIVLRVEFGYTYERLAAAMGWPSANAARMALVRALDRLAREIDRE
jgi:RNA polymerase sigma-70 factor (ECF subfamily)